MNVPITATEAHFRHLFSVQLSAGRVDHVFFHDTPSKAPGTPAGLANRGGGKKRKRVTADDLEAELDTIDLPTTWPRELRTSGAHALVVFVDRPAMEASLKAAKRAAKKGTRIIWGEGVEGTKKVAPLGLERYQAHSKMVYPNRAELLKTLNDFMTVFDRLEDTQARTAAMATQKPDEDGFVTVARPSRVNHVAKEEELKELMEKQRQKNQGLEDFYKFQTREKRKEKQNELQRKFEEDKRKLEEIKARKGKLKVCAAG